MAKIRQTPSELRAKRESKTYNKKHNPVKKKPKQKKKPIVRKLPYETYEVLRKMTYPEYLKSKYWKHVRTVVLKRDGKACMVCKKTYALQVHHESYKHRCNELNHLGDLITLCKMCHTEHHYAQM